MNNKIKLILCFIGAAFGLLNIIMGFDTNSGSRVLVGTFMFLWLGVIVPVVMVKLAQDADALEGETNE